MDHGRAGDAQSVAGQGNLEDALLLRAQTIPIGVAVTYATVLALAAWVTATWDAPGRLVICVVLGFALVSATVIAFLPHDRILRSRWREPFFLTWSQSYIAAITIMAAADGGAHSPVTLVYFLTLVFAALSYPFKQVILITATTFAAFLGLALIERSADAPAAVRPESVWLFATCLALVGLMCIWQARVNARHIARLGRLSRIDPLTGCLNRFGFSERLEAELARAAAGGTPVGLVLLDLVGFKAVNDTRGHPAGDELLAWVAHALGRLLRPGDAVGRLGGDEFAILLPGADTTRAAEIGDRTRRALAERIDVTAGCASAPEDGTGSTELIRSADERLYASRGVTTAPAVRL